MLLSVITVNRNNCEGLRRTIESVVAQSQEQDFEYLVIDGASTDDSVKVIKSFSDNIVYWVSETDDGIYDAMNKGVSYASGEYVIFLNSGDSFSNADVISSILGCLRNIKSDTTILVGRVNIVDVYGHVVRTHGIEEAELTPFSMLLTSIPHQATIIPRKLLLETPYDTRYPIIADWHFILKTVVFGDCKLITDKLVVADYDNSGVSSNYQRLLSEKEKALIDLLPKGVRTDYQRLIPYSKDYYRVKWCMCHLWVIKLIRSAVSLLMRLMK